VGRRCVVLTTAVLCDPCRTGCSSCHFSAVMVAHTPSHTWSPPLHFVLRPGVETIDFDTDEMIVVKIKSQTPKVPFGTAFSCHVQYAIRANDDMRTARIHASGHVEWTKSCAYALSRVLVNMCMLLQSGQNSQDCPLANVYRVSRLVVSCVAFLSFSPRSFFTTSRVCFASTLYHLPVFSIIAAGCAGQQAWSSQLLRRRSTKQW
jgi:hypothetical protein